jgi:hypothetical protein
LTRPPSAIREAIARTRDDLASHLAALRDRLLNPTKFLRAPPEADMATKSTKRKPSASPSSRRKGSQDEARKKTTASPKEKAAAKSSHPSKSDKVSARGKAKTGGSRKKAGAHGLVARTGEVLDTALAGAVVGAVTGAAQTLAQEPTAVTSPPAASRAPQAKSPKPASTTEVLSEMAPGAALGALSGAAKAVIPPAPKPPARRAKR